MRCGFVFWWRHLAKAWGFRIIKINAGMLSGLNFRLFRRGIQVWIMCHWPLCPFQD
jgi:hypothetical protein